MEISRFANGQFLHGKCNCYSRKFKVSNGASINHVDGILDIFDPRLLVDRHGFLANPPRKPCEVLEDPTPLPSYDSNFYQILVHIFYKNQIATIQIKTPNLVL